MPDSPSAWLRSLADKSTRTVDPSMPDQDWLEKAYARRDLFALAPDLAVLCADAIDALRCTRDAIASPDIAYAPGKDIYDTHMMMGAMRRADAALARFAALQPENTEEGTK